MSWIANIAILAFVVLVIAFAIRGYRRGLLGSLEGLIALAATAVVFYRYLQDLMLLVRQYTPLDGLLAYLLLWIALYVAALLAIKLIFAILKRLLPESFSDSGVSRLGGLIVGGIFGVICGTAVVYLMSIYDEARHPHGNVDNIALYDFSRSATAALTKAVVKQLDPAPASLNLAESFARSPVATTRRIERVAGNQELQQLFNDTEAQQLMTDGRVDELLASPRFQSVMANTDIQSFLNDLGWRAQDLEGQRQVAENVTVAWQRREALQQDPRVRAIVEDPEFQRQLRDNNRLQLMMNPQLARLTEIVFSEINHGVGGDLRTEQRYRIKDDQGTLLRELDGGAGGSEVDIYQRRNESGVIHYSDY